MRMQTTTKPYLYICTSNTTPTLRIPMRLQLQPFKQRQPKTPTTVEPPRLTWYQLILVRRWHLADRILGRGILGDLVCLINIVFTGSRSHKSCQLLGPTLQSCGTWIIFTLGSHTRHVILCRTRSGSRVAALKLTAQCIRGCSLFLGVRHFAACGQKNVKQNCPKRCLPLSLSFSPLPINVGN